MIERKTEYSPLPQKPVQTLNNIKELYTFRSVSEIERYAAFRSFAVSILGLSAFSQDDLHKTMKEVELKYKRSSAAYFGSLIRKGFINYNDLNPDGTVNMKKVKDRYNYLPEESFSKEFAFLQNYKVSEKTTKKATTYTQSHEDINALIMMDVVDKSESQKEADFEIPLEQTLSIPPVKDLIDRIRLDDHSLTKRIGIDENGNVTEQFFNANGINISNDHKVREIDANGKTMTIVIPKAEEFRQEKRSLEHFTFWKKPAFRTS